MERFFELIDRLSELEEGDERRELERTIWERYGLERAVLVLDLSHFSLSVRRSGILEYLQVIRRMQRIAKPIVQKRNGHSVKFEADNLIAIYPDCLSAVESAVELQQHLADAKIRSTADPEQIIGAAIGIDFGKLLHIEGRDCIGDPVNIAYKLGEDLAARGEILLTENAKNAVAEKCSYPLIPQEFSISGLNLTAFRVEYGLVL